MCLCTGSEVICSTQYCLEENSLAPQLKAKETKIKHERKAVQKRELSKNKKQFKFLQLAFLKCKRFDVSIS